MQGDVAVRVFEFLDYVPCLHRALGGGGGGGVAALWRVSSAARAYFGSEPFTQQLATATRTLAAAADAALRTDLWDDAMISAALTHRARNVRRPRPLPHPCAPPRRSNATVCVRAGTLASSRCGEGGRRARAHQPGP